jgi:hypothetical protein
MGMNYYFDRKNSEEQSKTISELIGFLDAKTVRERLFEKIHICKISAGWKPLFEKTDHYGSLDELKAFYEQNKDQFRVINEDREPVDLYDLLSKCDERYNDDTNTSHLSLKSHDYHRWLCSSGYEWTNGKFS